MKRLGLFFVSLLLLATFARADVVVTEIMYNPDQAADSDAEWVELFNNGMESVDLKTWTIQGEPLQGMLEPRHYLVVARELTDGDDEDLDSFQSIWGQEIDAVEASLSLLNSEDSINLTGPEGSMLVHYSSDLGADGNGRSLELFNGTWNESLVDGGTPGFRNSHDSSLADNEVSLVMEVQNALPELSIEIETDDSEESSVQIVANSTREVKFVAEVDDANGHEDVKNVIAKLGNETLNMSKAGNGSYEGVFILEPDMEKGMHEIEVTAFDSRSNVSGTAQFEFIGVIATIVETRNLDFELVPGTVSDEKVLKISNNGTASVQVNLSAVDTGKIPEQNIEILLDNWTSITEKGFMLMPGETKELAVRIRVPRIKAGFFEGKIIVTSR